jgi:hypothetical protein
VGDKALPRGLGWHIARLGQCPDGVLVRSSAVEEGLHERGTLDSVRCEPTAASVTEAVRRIAGQAEPSVTPRLGFVVQRWVPDAARGHLSNERRVSRDPRSWLCEAELDVDILERSFRFRTDSETKSAHDSGARPSTNLPPYYAASHGNWEDRDGGSTSSGCGTGPASGSYRETRT